MVFSEEKNLPPNLKGFEAKTKQKLYFLNPHLSDFGSEGQPWTEGGGRVPHPGPAWTSARMAPAQWTPTGSYPKWHTFGGREDLPCSTSSLWTMARLSWAWLSSYPTPVKSSPPPSPYYTTPFPTSIPRRPGAATPPPECHIVSLFPPGEAPKCQQRQSPVKQSFTSKLSSKQRKDYRRPVLHRASRATPNLPPALLGTLRRNCVKLLQQAVISVSKPPLQDASQQAAQLSRKCLHSPSPFTLSQQFQSEDPASAPQPHQPPDMQKCCEPGNQVDRL